MTARSSTTSRGTSLTSLFPNLDALLDAHRIERSTETPLVNAGYSGSALSRVRSRDGAAFVLKRMSIERDWIMRATDDVACREAAFAIAVGPLGPHLRTPAIGAARDGDGYALLMADITPFWLPESISEDDLDVIIDRVAALHARRIPQGGFPWCDAGLRLTLLSPERARIAVAYGSPAGETFLRGWERFEARAPRDVVDAIASLWADPSPLVAALNALPQALLHGDLKLDNIGIDPDGQLWLIDWAMPLISSTALELGWFVAINSRRVPVSNDAILDRYAAAAQIQDRERHDALAALCGLVLRGWRKSLDADEGEAEELRWWCDRARAGLRFL